MEEKSNFKQALLEIMGMGVAEDESFEQTERKINYEKVLRREMKSDEIFETTKPTPPINHSLKSADGLTTIGSGTVVIGEIHAEGSVDLLGSLKGKISTKGDIKVKGKVLGDIFGKDVQLKSCEVQGNIIATGYVSLDEDSLAVGDVTCDSFQLDGKLKGNVTVEKEAKFQSKAILLGDVMAGSIDISQGTKIQGNVNIPMGEKETDTLFDIDITI